MDQQNDGNGCVIIPHREGRARYFWALMRTIGRVWRGQRDFSVPGPGITPAGTGPVSSHQPCRRNALANVATQSGMPVSGPSVRPEP